jgi:hypothetical protein
MADIRQMALEMVVPQFEDLEDPRSTVNPLHPVVSVVVIAVLASAAGPTAIITWAALRADFLVEVLDLSNGILRKDVFQRVLMALKPGEFQACLATWLQTLRAADGRTARRSVVHKGGPGAPRRILRTLRTSPSTRAQMVWSSFR